jgi:TPR repeat protein
MGGTSITEWMLQMPQGEVRRLFGESPERTAGWVRVLALAGVARAQVCYAQMLLEGAGVDKNEREAFAWFTRAALQGAGTPAVREAVHRIAESVGGAVKSRPAVETRSA